MKIKTLLFISIIFILVFIIYLTTIDREIYYVNLSIDNNTHTYDKKIKTYLKEKKKLEKYINEFVSSDDRTTDLIYSIKENKSVIINNKKQTIKNSLIKADLVTLFIGLNEINYKVGYSSMNDLYDYADSFLNDINELFKLLREYCKEDIIIIGYHNIYGTYYDEYFDYINREVKLLASEYNIEFIETDDMYTVDEKYNFMFLDEENHKYIFDKIKNIIDSKILK